MVCHAPVHVDGTAATESLRFYIMYISCILWLWTGAFACKPPPPPLSKERHTHAWTTLVYCG